MSISSMAQRAPRPPGFPQNGEFEIPDLWHDTLAQAFSLSPPKQKNVNTWLIIVIKERVHIGLIIVFIFFAFVHFVLQG